MKKAACPRRNENESRISADPMVNNRANLCGEMITIGKKVKAIIMQAVPQRAKMANIVNLSFVFCNSSTDERAAVIFVEAHPISPADSSSCCTMTGGGGFDANQVLKPPEETAGSVGKVGGV